MLSKMGWVALGGAFAFVLIVIVLMLGFWGQIGDARMSPIGWAAMIFGILLTLALGVGLMALMFISNRRGYDEPGRDDL